MLIYDRRRCRPIASLELRRRLTLPQRAKLSHLELSGWTLLFVRGEPATVFVTHGDLGQATVSCDGRLVMEDGVQMRDQDEQPVHEQVPAVAVASRTDSSPPPVA